MKYARRVDRNHGEVVKAFRDMGCFVLDLSSAGRGVFDLLVAYKRASIIVEVKDGEKCESQTRLTPAQQKLWNEYPAPKAVVRTVDEVLAVVHFLRDYP